MANMFGKFWGEKGKGNESGKNSAQQNQVNLQNAGLQDSSLQSDDLQDLQDRFELSPQNVAKNSDEKIELKPDNDTKSADKIIAHSTQGYANLSSNTTSEKKIILFDLDGTLLDSLEGIYASFCRACEEEEGKEAYAPSLEEVRSMIGLPLREMFLRVGFSQDEVESRITRYKNHYRRICIEKSRLYPKVREALILAREFAHLGVVTTKTGLYSKQILENFELLKYFGVVIGIEDVSEPKPDAEPILRALSFLPIAPKQKVYMIGDTILDIESAKNAGVNALWVRCGYGQGLESQADKSFDSVYEAVAYIKEVR